MESLVNRLYYKKLTLHFSFWGSLCIVDVISSTDDKTVLNGQFKTFKEALRKVIQFEKDYRLTLTLIKE